MSAAVATIDALALIAFSIALWMVLASSTKGEGPVGVAGKYCMAVAMAIYVLAMASNVLEHAGITSLFDQFEDYGEILFPPFVLYTAWMLFVRMREIDLVASQRAALRAQAMTLDILDSTPAGIMVLDASGRVTFANETARAVLELDETGSGDMVNPGWTVSTAGGDGSRDFSVLLGQEPGERGIPVRVEWPSGWRLDLDVKVERMGDSSGRLGGMVATFLPPEGLIRGGPDE